jgi:hypothetical protein
MFFLLCNIKRWKHIQHLTWETLSWYIILIGWNTQYIMNTFCKFNIQGIHKRMVQFQKLLKTLFLTLHGHNIHCQQRELSKFLMLYQQFTSHAYCGVAGPVSKMASQQDTASVCSILRCPNLWLECCLSFVHGLKETLFLCGASFF